MVEGLDALLSPEGWAYASTPPQAEGDPGRYHALFGRDSLITALQVLPARPDVARATLRALAALQGQRDDPETDEEPGKILHEYWPVAPQDLHDRDWPVRDGRLL
jgi:glycogen debranching enzyme